MSLNLRQNILTPIRTAIKACSTHTRTRRLKFLYIGTSTTTSWPFRTPRSNHSSSMNNGQAPAILSFPTAIAWLDYNFVYAITGIYAAGVFLFSIFLCRRAIRAWILRKPLRAKLDQGGKTVLIDTRAAKFLRWPRQAISRIALRSWARPGVPSLGVMLLLVGWIGITAVSCVWRVAPGLNVVGVAYRLP